MSSVSNSNSTLSTIVGQITEALGGAQTEIVIFVFAFSFHALFFGGLKGFTSRRTKAVDSSAPDAPALNGAQGTKPSHRSHHAKEMARCSARLCELKGAAQVAAELSLAMQAVPTEDTTEALVGLLECAGRSSTPDLLASVQDLLHERGLTANLELGELLLNSFGGLRMLSEFDILSGQLLAAHGNTPSLVMLVFKVALRRSDLKAALYHAGCLRSFFSQGCASSPTSAPSACLQQLVKLAATEDSIPQLLDRLKEVDMLQHALDIVLVECLQRADSAAVELVMRTLSTEGLQFGDAAYCALIKGARSPGEALSLFVEAADLRLPSNELLKAASAYALSHGDAQLANKVLLKLPPHPPVEVVGNILRCHSETQAEEDADGAVLEMYQKHFRDLDLSGDRHTMYLVALAAIRRSTQASPRIKGQWEVPRSRDCCCRWGRLHESHS